MLEICYELLTKDAEVINYIKKAEIIEIQKEIDKEDIVRYDIDDIIVRMNTQEILDIDEINKLESKLNWYIKQIKKLKNKKALEIRQQKEINNEFNNNKELPYNCDYA